MFKKLARSMMVSWRKEPTRYDIEALQANISRVWLVIRVRWILVAVLALYSVLATAVYTMETPLVDVVSNMTVPAAAMVFVLMYNTYYQLTYRHLGNIAILNHAQLFFDALVVTVLVYYSGGVHSWFWAMYSLFILEAAFILPRRWHAYWLAGVSAFMIGVVLWGEYFQWIPHRHIPYTSESLYRNLTFVTVRYMWQLAVLIGTATVSTLMTSRIRMREEELEASSIIDDKTGLYDRAYFHRMLASELLRAERDARRVSLILVDLDGFARVNTILGYARGDQLLRMIAQKLHETVYNPEGRGSEMNVVCRYGGEEFAIIVAENDRGSDSGPTVDDAFTLAEAVRLAVECVRLDDAGVTASLGVVSFPDDGMNAEELLSMADEALARASMNRRYPTWLTYAA
jgi:diguanylate cyclase (GGDEF)-like protein